MRDPGRTRYRRALRHTASTIPYGVAVGALALTLMLSGARADAVSLFFEDFEGFTSFPSTSLPKGPRSVGLPTQTAGAKEAWTGGRFEQPNGGTIGADLGVKQAGGPGNDAASGHNSNVGWFEDEAGLLFNISTQGFGNATLSFDWRTLNVVGDQLVAGYFVGQLPGSGNLRDFVSLLGGHTQAVNWWNQQWTQIVRDENNVWQAVSVPLPTGQSSLWGAFWLDNGENNVGLLDNVSVTADPLLSQPEPSTLILLGTGLIGLAGYGWRQRKLVLERFQEDQESAASHPSSEAQP